MSGYLYILETKGNRYYVGSTNNLERRMDEHNHGKTKSLVNLLPIRLVFIKKYGSLEHARKIELKLKKFKNKKIIDRIVQEQVIITGL